MTLDLNVRISEEIFFAGRAAPGSMEAQSAYLRISVLEEQIARITTPDAADGALARVGAVYAALRASDWLRAARLIDEFMEDAPVDVAEELRLAKRQLPDLGRP